MATPKLTIKSDRDFEFNKVKDTLKKLDWFIAQGYVVGLPKIDLDELKNISDKNLYKLIDQEMKTISDVVLDYIKRLEIDWEKNAEETIIGLKNLIGSKIQTEYLIFLTQYGPGGGYYYPNKINIKLHPPKEGWSIGTLIHEIIHLSIHPLIEKYQIEHWTKERLVDLISLKIFPGKFKLQRDPENNELVKKYFEQYYPDIEKIISAISKI